MQEVSEQSDTDTAPLTADERASLAECEATIERGLHAFVAVGKALQRIRDEGLYRSLRENGTRRTYAEYCLERWRLSESSVWELRQAAKVVANLEISGVPEILPTSIRQAIPLAAVSIERQAEVWARALEEAGAGKVTGPVVQRIVDEELGRHEARQARKEAERQQARDVAALAEELGIEPVNEDEHSRTATLLYGFFRAIRTLAEMPPPAEVIGLMRPDQEYHLTAVGPAIAWLAAFDAELEKQRA